MNEDVVQSKLLRISLHIAPCIVVLVPFHVDVEYSILLSHIYGLGPVGGQDLSLLRGQGYGCVKLASAMKQVSCTYLRQHDLFVLESQYELAGYLLGSDVKFGREAVREPEDVHLAPR